MRENKDLEKLREVYYTKFCLGIEIKIIRIGWENISVRKHPELRDKFSDLIKLLKNPGQVWQSRIDKNVYLYYRKFEKKYLCAICRHYNHKGFLITAYYTHKI